MHAGSVQLRVLGFLVVGIACSIIACSGGGGGGTGTAQAPGLQLTFPQGTLTAVEGEPVTPLVPSVTGTVTAFTASPALPPGMVLDPVTGAIDGTPTAPTDPADYTITATAPGASAFAKLRIGVAPKAPSGLSYLTATIAATADVPIAADTPTCTGTVTTYTVSPALPAGLSINMTTGAITGTPTVTAASQAHTVYASNATGYTTATVTVSVVPYPAPPTGLSYAQPALTATVGQPITADTPAVTGLVNTYTVSPALPAGLALNATTGAITGTPTAAAAAAAHTIYASNAAGFATATVTITVNTPLLPPSGLTYPQTTIAAVQGQAIAADVPAVTGTVTSYTIAPGLPAGLTLSPSTGVLAGTPTGTAAAATYTITASNQAGFATARINLTVTGALQPPTALSYSPAALTATVGLPIAALAPAVTGTVTGYTAAPAFPAGVAFDTTTGVISGTPTAPSGAQAITITASNAAGAATTTFTLTVKIPAPSGLSYASPTIAATLGEAIATDLPTVTGTVTAYAIAPALPAGLAFSATTGALSGTPTATLPATVYTVTASNGTGSTTASVSLSVQGLAAPSNLLYPATTLTLTVGQAMAAATPTVTGTVTAFSIAPALPAGLSLAAATGAITGTPTLATPSTSYTVTASNATGSTEATLLIATDAPTGGAGIAGFMGLFQDFPSSALYASAKTAAAMAANPWMKGTRFFVGTENICQDSVLPASTWTYDTGNVTGFKNPLDEVMIRMNADPDGAWNVQSSGTVGTMDAVVAGVVGVAKAAGSTSFMLDAENYSTLYLLNNYNQTSAGSPILNSPVLSRTQMCAELRAFGKAFGTSLWSRVPTARLYLFFGSTVVISYTNGGTGIPTSCPDSSYANDPRYNMIPYFCLGLLDACPAGGCIVDYIERSYYDFTGLASLKRNMTASKNWVSIFFPAETADIAKSVNCWVPVPLIYGNPYFSAASSIYPGAYYVTSASDQLAYFTRNCVYCLQQTPAGFMPGIYIESYDPWGLTGTVSNPPATWQTGLNNAVSVYKGTLSLSSLFNATALVTDLEADFKSNPAWAAECQ